MMTLPNRADERLLIEAAQRERARFAEVYDEYFEIVYAYVARRMQLRAEIEDISSEVFHKALKHLPGFKWTGVPFVAWLLRIARNTIADRAKRVARETKLDSNDLRLSVNSSRQFDLEQAERLAQLFRLVGELPQDQQRVIRLRFADEKSIKEIAGELQRSEGAVKQLQFRGLENLRKKFASEDTKTGL